MSGFNLADILDLLKEANESGINFTLEEERLYVQTPEDREIDTLFLTRLKDNKHHLITYFKQHLPKEQSSALAGKIPAVPRAEDMRIPLSFSQERLWFVDQLEGTVSYHMPAALRLTGTLDVEALAKHIRTIVNRHEVLRTVIEEEEGTAYQRILAKDLWQLQHVDGTNVKDEASLQQLLSSLVDKPFDLSRDHMLRADLVKISDQEHILALVMHHIASDGWSVGILVGELTELYRADATNTPAELPELDIQYADFAIWQRNQLTEEVLDAQLAYWKRQLNATTPLELPTDFERPLTPGNKGETLTFDINSDLLTQLQQLSQEHDCTLFMTLMATFQVMLYRYSGQDDICVGTPAAGRVKSALEPLIGFFVNTLAIRSRIAGQPAFVDFLRQVRTTTLDAYEHQDVPFEKVVETVVKERNTGRTPLFQVMFALQNVPASPELEMGSLQMQDEPLVRSTSLFDLLWSMEEHVTGLRLTVQFSTELFSGNTIHRMFDHFTYLLKAVVNDPQRTISSLRMLTDTEEKELVSFNDNTLPYPEKDAITTLFEKQVATTPTATAVVFGDEKLTYQQLNEQADQLAVYLRANGVQEEVLVPMCIDRSLNLMVGILGILKAGGAYVPIDPAYPQERIAYMIRDTNGKVALIDSAYTALLKGVNPEMTTVLIDQDDWRQQVVAPFTARNTPDTLAYVIYTSGSTGRPKGTLVTHKNVTSLATGGGFVSLTAQDVLLSTGSPSFDATTIEYWGMLLNGGQLILMSEKQLLEQTLLKQEIKKRGITLMWFTASWFNQLIDEDITIFEGLKTVMTGGEKLSETHIRKFQAAHPHIVVMNGYGPTENTTFSLTHDIPHLEEGHRIPIGKPLANRTAYVLSNDLQLLPVGVPGELYLGGVGVSRGYLHQENLTAERFINDPFSDVPGAKLYKTGDRARWLANGTVEFMGRIDEQVKIRGFRIEPGEIDAVLRQCPGVKDAVVTVDTSRNGEKRLVGYVVPVAEYDHEQIFDYLRDRLPAYMVPAFLIRMEILPLTANGKVDKRALPAPDDNALFNTTPYTAPRDEKETAIIAIWERLLGVAQVGIHNNFFELGGHSLLATRVVSAIRKELETALVVKDLFTHPTVAQLAAYLQTQQGGIDNIVATIRPDKVPLSFNQERLWFIDQLEGTTQYHLPVILRLRGTLQSNALQEALSNIVQRHESLRTVIRQADGQPYQHVLPANSWQLQIVNDPLYVNDLAARQQYLESVIYAPFDLASEHMLRAHLIVLSKHEHLLVLNMHHIATDGWSMSILVNEVIDLYRAFTTNYTSPLAPLPVQYADYAIWQRNSAQAEQLSKQLVYWKEQLTGVTPLDLPTDYNRPATQTVNGTSWHFNLDNNLLIQLKQLSQQQGATLFMTLLAAFKVLLHRYSRQEDITVGSPVSGRTRQETEALIGFFVNTLTLRTQLSAGKSFLSLLQDVKKTALDAFANQDVPFERVVEAVVKDRDLTRSPLFQAMFILQNTPHTPDLQLGELDLSYETVAQRTSQFELTFSLEETTNGLEGHVEYNTDLFSETTISAMARHFSHLLREVVANPARALSDFGMLDQAEQYHLVHTLNQTVVNYPDIATQTLISLFRQQVQKTPEATAIVFEGNTLTYAQLDTASNRLANYLLANGADNTKPVALCVERSLEMIVGIWGILKAGAAYMPVDPAYPANRIGYMLEDAGALILTQEKFANEIQTIAAATTLLLLDKDQDKINKAADKTPDVNITPQHAAYVIYTSGSTGRPKGVVNEHGGIVNRLLWKQSYFNIDSNDAILQKTTFCFDVSVWELIWPSLNGARMVLAHPEGHKDPSYLQQVIEDQHITTIHFVPSMLSVFLDQLPAGSCSSLRRVICSGEALKPAQVRALHTQLPAAELYNLYGPTEAAIDVTYWHAPREEKISIVPIGRPVSNTALYILDATGNLQPQGVWGELYISGVQVAREYLNLPDLTAERFIADPFAAVPGTRMYKTGDLCRWMPDGNIEYQGRIDNQVKVRGFRIELGEIEGVLQESDLVKDAVVTAFTGVDGNYQLAAYIVPAGDFDKEGIYQAIRQQLPDYMVPAILIPLDRIPLSSNGKADKKALPAPTTVDGLATREYVAPRTETEQIVAHIWQELLAVEKVGVHDNFFELGGHSLLSMRLIAAVRKRLGVELPVKALFVHTTIATLAEHVLQQKGQQALLPTITPAVRPERIPLSFSQERLWFIDQLEGSVQYHMPAALRLSGILDKTALSFALTQIVHRHESLRTVIKEDDGRAYQTVLPNGKWKMGVIDKPLYKKDPAALQALIQEITEQPFNLAKDHMLRVQLISLGKETHILVLVMHHIASDGWSVNLLVKELVALYHAYSSGHTPPLLTPLPLQYADYAIWQRTYLTGAILDNKLAYWQHQLSGVTPLELPLDYSRPAAQSINGAMKQFRFDKSLYAGLQQLAHQTGATLYMTVLAAFKVLLYRYSRQEDICIGTPVDGRMQQETEELIGYFVNTLALRSDLSGKPSFRKLLQQVKRTTLDAFEHQEVPFEKIVDTVVKERDLSRSPIFQVLFGWQKIADNTSLSFGTLAFEEEKYEHTTSKFEMSFLMEEQEEGIGGSVVYCTDLFNAATVDRMVSHFEQLLKGIVAQPDEAIDSFALLTATEQTQLKEFFQRAPVSYKAKHVFTVTELFEHKAALYPSANAVVFEDTSLTYQQLNDRANQLARYLNSNGVKKGSLVPLYIERSVDMIVGILGIIKAGAAYVPIDPEHPTERIAWVLEDTAASIAITCESCLSKFPSTSAQLLALDSDWDKINWYPATNIPLQVNGDDPVYVIYTSGSTGRPKGVIIAHRHLADYFYGLRAATPIADSDSFGLLSSIATDLGNTVLFGSLLGGGTLHLFSKTTINDIDILATYFQEKQIDCIKIVPSHWKALSTPGRLLLPQKLLVFGGEVLETSVIADIRAAGASCVVVNHYGPTETTIGKLLHIVGDVSEYGKVIPIGKPFSNTQVYILGPGKQLCPVGVPGELYIGGDGVATGYLNNKTLTAEKFITDPVNPANGKVYCTGDVVKYLPNGNIIFQGRADDQVKIRGYRIELGEIERVLNQHEHISQAVVLAKADTQGNKRLVAYVVADASVDKNAINTYLKVQLPDYMVPAQIQVLDQFPMLANGKIDKRSLPEAEITPAIDAYIPARNETEQVLVQIWEEVLGAQRIGVTDNFFELGGDSIITIQVVSRARRHHLSLQVADIFNHQTIAALSALLATRTGGVKAINAEQGLLTGAAGLLPIQQWYFEKEQGVDTHYNQSILLEVDKNISQEVWNAAIRLLTQQHDSLRFTYHHTDGQWIQQYSELETLLSVKDLRKTKPDALTAAIAKAGEEGQRRVNLSNGTLLSATLILTHKDVKQNRLLLAIHHLAVDGISWRVILEDLEILLEALQQGTAVSLGEKTSSYREWYQALSEYAQRPAVQTQADYWETATAQYRPAPVDHSYNGPLHRKDIATYQVKLDAALTRQLLQEVAPAYRTDINDLLLSAMARVLNNWAGRPVTIGLEGHGREDISTKVDISRTVGWFTSQYPLTLDTTGITDNGLLIRHTKEILRQIPDKGLGYGVLKYLAGHTALQGETPWDITFNYLGQLDSLGGKNSKWITPAEEAAGSTMGEAYVIRRRISVNGMVAEGTLLFDWDYSTKHYNPDTIHQLAEQYVQALTALISHAAIQVKKQQWLTPSDLGLGGLVQAAELDNFLYTPLPDGSTRNEQISSIYRLSGLQEGMLFHGLYDGNEEDAYTEQFTWHLKNLNRDIFVQSWEYLLQKHSILRSAFIYDVFRIPVQCVYRNVTLPLEELDFRHLKEELLEQACKEYEHKNKSKGFDFAAAPLMRVGLIRVADDKYRMIWTCHHLLIDGWSMPILIEELSQAYEALVNGATPSLGEEDRYEDYIRFLESRDKGAENEHWKNYLGNVSTNTLLPFVNATAERTKGKGTYLIEQLHLDEERTRSINTFAQQKRLTVNTLMQGAWAYLLYKYTGSNDVSYGIIVSGRPDELPGIEKRVGMYINTLPFHTAISGEQRVIDWLLQIQQEQVKCRQYQYTPIQEAQRWTGIPGDLFDTLMVYENYPVDRKVTSVTGGLQGEQEPVEEHTNYPLSIAIGAEKEIAILFQYNSALLDVAYIHQLKTHFDLVLSQLVSMADAPITALSLMAEADKQVLDKQFNNTAAPYPDNETITNLFAVQVRNKPQHTAIVFGDDRITYEEFDARSNQVAHFLAASGIPAGSMVGLLAYRGFDMMVAMMGILKSGCAYVPFHIEYPAERYQMMIEDAGIQHVLYTDQELFESAGIDANIGLHISGSQVYSKGHFNIRITPETAAYVMYTSGTTGRPKGIAVDHRNILKLVYDDGPIAINGDDILMQWSNYAFDGSTYDIFSAFLMGATLVLIRDEQASDIYALTAILAKEKVNVSFMTTALFNSFVDTAVEHLLPLRMVLFGGEMVSLTHVKKAFAVLGPGKMVHVYGPTETTTYATYYAINELAPHGHIPIGRPLANTRILLLDTNGQVVPPGVNGELYIGGDGVAIGYVNNEKQTSERFITVPGQDGRWYRSGDLGRWLPDGNIVYTGRADNQVKIRGYRIEPGEIETVLLQCPQVSEAIVTVHTDANGTKKLLGYVIPEGEFDKSAIVTFLKGRLPDYMVPSMLIGMEKWPLTVNGKIDKKGLPAPSDADVLLTNSYVAPHNEIEKQLAGIWQELLNRRQVGRNDNFFELGGDSIITIQVVSRAKRFGYTLQPRDLFVHQTVGALANLLASRQTQAVSAEQGVLTGQSGLLPIQQWYFESESTTLSHFNQSMLLAVDKKLNTAILSTVITQLVAYHDSLRFVYDKASTGWTQTYGTATGALEIADVTTAEGDSLEEQLYMLGDQYARSLDINNGILFRAVLIQMPEQEECHRLLFVVHHLAVDGVSWRILLGDIERLLEAATSGAELSLGLKGSSYREWYNALNTYSRQPRLQRQRDQWLRVVQNYHPVPVDMPFDGVLRGDDMGLCSLRLSPELTRQLLQEVPRAYHTEINDVLLSALSAVLYDWAGANISIGLEGHGREDISADIDISQTVGWFTTMYPIQPDASTRTDRGRLLREVKEYLRQVPDKGLGYGVFKYILNDEAFHGNEPWDITFNYLGQFDSVLQQNKWFRTATESAGSDVGDDYRIRHKFSVSSIVEKGELLVYISYSQRHYKEETIQQLTEKYVQELEQLILHALRQLEQHPIATPSDFGLTGLATNAELDSFIYHRLTTEQFSSVYRLSSLQEGMFFHSLYDSSAGHYTIQFTGLIYHLNVPMFIQSWQYLLQQHTILRSAFFHDAFQVPVQSVFRNVTMPVTQLDFTGMTEEDRKIAIDRIEEEERSKPFDLDTPPLMRLILVRLQDDHYRMVWTFSHLLVDGWSLPILISGLLQNYEDLMNGQQPLVQEDRYEDYIRHIERKDKYGAETFWRKYLAEAGNGTLLPFVPQTAERTKGKGDYQVEEMILDAGRTATILAYAQQQRVTVNTVIQAVWAYLLSSYTGQQRVTYGVTVSGRPDDLAGVEQRVGLYINTLPLCTAVDPEQEVTAWLQQIQQEQVQSREYQYTSLNDIQRWLEVSGELFDSFLAFENFPVDDLLSVQEWQLQLDETFMQDHANYPLGISATVSKDIRLALKYNRALLDTPYALLILEGFDHILRQLCDRPQVKVKELSLLTAAATRQLLVDFNKGDFELNIPKGTTVLDLFDEQVKVRPDATALVFDNDFLTYAELDERANQLAHYLRNKGVKEEMLVPVCILRSLDMVVALFGILKAGATYLPIDSSYPMDRITYMIEDSRATVMITSSDLAEQLQLPAGPEMIYLDTDDTLIRSMSVKAPQTALTAENMAYVIYTSGSTGRPKGVMIEHRGVVNLAMSQAISLRLEPGMRTLQFAAFGFDASCYEIFNTLLSGGCLVIPRQEDLMSAAQFGALVRSQQVDLVTLPPSYQHTIREELGSIRTIVSAGEPLNREDGTYFQSKGIRLVNAYGPTENTVCTSLTDNPILPTAIVIGKPVANVQIYVLRPDRSLAPVGVSGEICVGGANLARGYLHRPELTAEKFIPHPFSNIPGDRIYKTGDLGRWLPDGNIEYQGRIDEQVKIRGYRIEPGEIEHALEQSGHVSQAIVLAKGEGDSRGLVAYIIPEQGFDRNEVMTYLAGRLPEYMVPAQFVSVESFPITANGKIDKKALLSMETIVTTATGYSAARNALEAQLVSMWEELLEIDHIGINDDFFELGGHSLLSIRLVSAIKKEMGIDVSLSQVFEVPTVAGLAAVLDRIAAASAITTDTTAAKTPEKDPDVLLLNKGDKTRPIFLIPGQDGLANGYDAVAAGLTTAGLVYGLQMPGVNEGDTPLDSMAAIATTYRERILSLQPQGPYTLVAHSFGSYVAWELTQQLEAMGKEVSILILLDAAAHPVPLKLEDEGKGEDLPAVLRNEAFALIVEHRMEDKLPADAEQVLTAQIATLSPKEIIPAVIKYLRSHLSGEKLDSLCLALRVLNMKVNNVAVLNTHTVGGSVNTPVVVVKAEQEAWPGLQADLGWAAHAAVQSHVSPGNHFSMLKNDNATALSALILKQVKPRS
ncbi:non-ribosomal peptide synthase/polyketide synthase [Chitinophaga pendula]|uniref:non-ribosomal peptide synthase/polyketide synthase n=1 Tax=Chitinophaga pendula TaxID=2849666 RepID=UPI001CEC5288|nr:non-ribosomal peptide synthase/polyketide synthase [Chitinophaga pendula]UCJ09145.1 non-ribosomal peptide synthase/polyketide synthase [Chitinophaga pendula]